MEEQTPNKNHKMLWLNVATAIAVAVVTFFVIYFTPLHRLMPGYLTPQNHEQVVNFALRLDSLQEAVARQNMYVTNLQDILKGRVRVDSVTTIDSLTALRAADLMERTEQEKEFARMYEETEKYNLTTQASRVGAVMGLNLTCPVRGTLKEMYNPGAYHYGVDVSADAKTPVVVALDGIVLFASYTASEGFVAVVQHNDELLSVYKHMGQLLVAEGRKLRSGEAVGVLGTFNEEDIESYLHFELWHKGVSLDPTLYIPF